MRVYSAIDLVALLLASAPVFASVAPGAMGPGRSETLSTAILTPSAPPQGSALPSGFNWAGPQPDSDMVLYAGGRPLTLETFLDEERSRAPVDTSEPEQAQRLSTLIGIVLLAGGLVLYLKSPAFRNWLNQLLFDAFSPLKYE